MRVVLTLRTRDQADLVDALVGFHLNAGVDFVIATDHRSVDGTAEILEAYAREGYVHVLRDPGEAITLRRSEMARLAATEYGADWVLHADGDEFWWPRGGSLREILASVPPRYGIVRGAWRHFAPRPDDGRHFAERMVARVSPYAEHTGARGPFDSGVKVVHRAQPQVSVAKGGHDVAGPGLLTLRGWYPFEVLHFPLRSQEQARAKYVQLMHALSAGGLHVPEHVEHAHGEIAAGEWDETYRRYLVDDEALGRGLAERTLVLDTRLRDALRTLAGVAELPPPPGRCFPLRGRRPRLDFPLDSPAGGAFYAHETQQLHELDAETRLYDRISALEQRLIDLERGLFGGLRLAGRR